MSEKTQTASATPLPATGPAVIELLGGLEVRNQNGQPVNLSASKSRLLLAYLAVTQDAGWTRGHLAGLLWSDRQEEQARGSLRTALSDIRRALGKDALAVSGDLVRLQPGWLVSDYDRLKVAADHGAQFDAVAEIYPGGFLAGFEAGDPQFSDWLRETRAECVDLALSALEARAMQLAGSGAHAGAITMMRDCLALEPFKEQNHRALMQLYAQTGERAMAMAQFRTCREILMHELGAEPAAETRAMADSIATNNAAAAAPMPAAQPEQHAQRMPESPDASTIAVLPFINMSGDAEQNYFADGITEDIITDLSRIDALSVCANISSQIYRGGSMGSGQIANELDVRYLLEGSVRKVGGQVRITARLVDAPASRQVWAERFDRPMTNIFELQTEIASAIVNALRLNLAPGPLTARRGTQNVEAHQEYLRARTFIREMTRKSLEVAREGFARAVVLDPEYAQAWAGLADAKTEIAIHYSNADDGLEHALAHARTALRLNPTLAEARCARGFAFFGLERHEEALEDFAAALELNPDLHQGHVYQAMTYGDQAQSIASDSTALWEKNIDSWRRAYKLASIDLHSCMMLMLGLDRLGRDEESRDVSKKVIETAQRRLSLNPHDERAAYVLAMALRNTGRLDEARQWADVSAALASEDSRTCYNIGGLFAMLGDSNRALEFLEKGLSLGSPRPKRLWIFNNHDLKSLRGDARFEALYACACQ